MGETIEILIEDKISIRELLEERAQSMAVITLVAEYEVEREHVVLNGVIFDNEGHIVIQNSVAPEWVTPEQLKDIKVHQLGDDGNGFDAKYLGRDFLTGWHYFKIIKDSDIKKFKSISEFNTAKTEIGELLWGIGFSDKFTGYQPYYLAGRLSLEQQLPWYFGVTTNPVAAPGGPVFNKNGQLVGIASRPMPQEHIFYTRSEYFQFGLKRVRESNNFLFSDDFYRYIHNSPEDLHKLKSAWLGVTGLQPVDKDTLDYHKLKNQGGVIVSDVIIGSPAEIGGLKSKDIIIEIDKSPLKKLLPDQVVSKNFVLEILKKKPGDQFTMTILREKKYLKLSFTLGESPKFISEAKWKYFPKLGFSVREFLIYDGIARRILDQSCEGVLAKYIRINSPAHSANLINGDWIKEINEEFITDYEMAIAILNEIEANSSNNYCVLLVNRGTETALIRINLNDNNKDLLEE